jgi:hypothetical protein
VRPCHVGGMGKWQCEKVSESAKFWFARKCEGWDDYGGNNSGLSMGRRAVETGNGSSRVGSGRIYVKLGVRLIF